MLEIIATDQQLREAAKIPEVGPPRPLDSFPLFVGPPPGGIAVSWVSSSAIEKSQAFGFSGEWRERQRAQRIGQRAAVLNSLVKASKSPTKQEIEETASKKLAWEVDQAFLAGKQIRDHAAGAIWNYDDSITEGRERVGQGAPGVLCIVEQRKWADEVRVRSQVEGANGTPPPAQEGPRISEWLTDNGLRKLTDSAAYVAAQRGGYTTFVTLTFDDQGRERLEKGKTTIQREASRCFDAWAKMYQRGLKRQGIAGNSDDFDYLWVVEVPDNEQGEPNPHLHVLMRWAVPFDKFEGWAGRLEKAWGQGFAHLEKIKDGKSAGAYIAKAIGYLCKAQGKSDQGTVRGNRYGISKSARAPGWELLSKNQLDCMSQLIADIYDHLSYTNGPDYKARKQLNEQSAAMKVEASEQRKRLGKKKSPAWVVKKQKKIAAALEKVRAKLDAVPVRASKYQVILKGEEATKTFFKWAYHPTGSKSILAADWLPEKPEGVFFKPGEEPKGNQSLYFSKLKAKFKAGQRQRWAVSDDLASWIEHQKQDFKTTALEAWELYNHNTQKGAICAI